MAKTTVKKAAKPEAAKVAKAKTSKPKVTKSIGVEEATELALEKLRKAGLDLALQANLEWCLGSYKGDGNPSGLYEFLPQAIKVLNDAKVAKVKGITAKLIADLESALPR